MLGNRTEVEKRLWDAGNEAAANPKLKSSESSGPMVGLTLLRYKEASWQE